MPTSDLNSIHIPTGSGLAAQNLNKKSSLSMLAVDKRNICIIQCHNSKDN